VKLTRAEVCRKDGIPFIGRGDLGAHPGDFQYTRQKPLRGFTKLSRRRQLKHQPLGKAYREEEFQRRTREECK